MCVGSLLGLPLLKGRLPLGGALEDSGEPVLRAVEDVQVASELADMPSPDRGATLFLAVPTEL